MGETRLGNWLRLAAKKLSGFSDTSGLDVQILAAHFLGRTKKQIIAYPEFVISEKQLDQLEFGLQRLIHQEALPYVIGNWEFYGRKFKLTQDVLIPRPETELLVETAIKWLSERSTFIRVAEAGIGSGCISISLAMEKPKLKIVASDISWDALGVAHQNILDYGLSHRIFLTQCDLLTAFKGQFDLICANLPYISTDELKKLVVSYREPHTALDGGSDGLAYIEKLIADSPRLLLPGGLLLAEIEENQSDMVKILARKWFPEAHIDVVLDYNEKPRLLRISRK